MPTFSAQAWIGGPFSNNSFFGDNADDGVYEAAATAVNGIGLYRIVVGNNFDGVNPTGVTTSAPSVTPVPVAGVVPVSVIGSGNTVVGGIASRSTNVWYFQGVFYRGEALGTASSVLGTVQCFGEARSSRVVNPVGTAAVPGVPGGIGVPGVPGIPEIPQDNTPLFTLNSAFTANFQGSGRFLPARAFSGSGELRLTSAAGVTGLPFGFSVFGSKVSSRITFGL